MEDRRFPVTSWTLIRELQGTDEAERNRLLDQLLRNYWKPVYHYVRSWNRGGASEAEDLTQHFFTLLLARGEFDRLSQERGSFRGFLLTALRHALSNAERAARARPALFPYEQEEATWQQRSADLAPDDAFERAWTGTVLSDALARLKTELEGDGRSQQYEIFAAYSRSRADGDALTYKAIAKRFEVSEDDVRNRLRETRLKLRLILKQIMRQYLGPEEDLERELRFVLGK